MVHDDNYEPVLRVTQAEGMMDQDAFNAKVKEALDDMAESYDPDDGRTIDEWVEELRTVIHNNA